MSGRARRERAITLVVALATALAGPAALRAQDASTMRGLDLEAAGNYREAASAFRAGLQAGLRVAGADSDLVGPLLGLERAYASLGWTDSLLPLLDTLVVTRPEDALIRSVQLRALVMAGREARAGEAFEAWVARARTDAQPYRDYARLLMEGGRTQAADSVLARAVATLGSGREVALELAQLRAQQGLWVRSAESWREAVAGASYLQQAAVFALQATPAPKRDSVRAALLTPPAAPPVRAALARLELGWGSPERAWSALSALAPTDSAVDSWLAFAEEADAAGATAAAFEAFRAALAHRPSPGLAARAAAAALEVGRAADALAIVEHASPTDSAATLLLPLRVRALSALDRPADAERFVAEVAARAPQLAPPLYRQLAWGWVRAGDVRRAREALARGDADPSDEVYGWLALYAGDLRGARQSLRATSDGGEDAVDAAALLARTRADSAPATGAAFLALARRDSAGAASAFERGASEVGDAAPFVLAMAARLRAALGDGEGAVALWTRLVNEHAASPEAVEADLAWARALRARGDTAGAAARLEHLILTYPGSALVPQARHELEQLRGSVPPAGQAQPTPPPSSPASSSPPSSSPGTSPPAGRD